MTLLEHDIALLERAAQIAGRAIWPEGDNVTVPERTLRALADELRAGGRCAEYRLIDREAIWLVEAAHEVTLHRADDNRPMVDRWTRVAELLRAAVALDLVNAKKSVGEFA